MLDILQCKEQYPPPQQRIIQPKMSRLRIPDLDSKLDNNSLWEVVFLASIFLSTE